MEPAQFVLPFIATSALAAAVFVPLRDDRRGRRATLSAAPSPLRLDFAPLVRTRQGTSAVTASQGDEELHGAIADAIPAPACIDCREAPMRVDGRAAEDDETASSDGPSGGAAKQRSPDRLIDRGALTTRDDDVSEFGSGEVPTAALPAAFARAVRLDALRAVFETWRIWPPMHDIAKLPMSLSPPPSHARDVDSGGDAATHDVVVERSFAVEVANLLTPPQDDDSLNECASARDDRTATIDGEPVNQSTSDQPDQPMVVRPRRAPVERIVPLTRLPLRTQSSDVTWFASLSIPVLPRSAQERHALLEEPSTARDFDLLVQAYRQEDERGRILALRALSAYHSRAAREIFTEALRAGTDDERVTALDALAASDARDALPSAFDDRVDAIAARAALAFVGTNRRSDYIAALEPYVDPAQIEAILALLAGFVE